VKYEKPVEDLSQYYAYEDRCFVDFTSPVVRERVALVKTYKALVRRKHSGLSCPWAVLLCLSALQSLYGQLLEFSRNGSPNCVF